MTEPLEKRLEKAMAELQSAQEAVARTERELRTASFAALSSDRAVRATAGPQGELTGIDFLENKYRDMSPQELAASVLEAANAARLKMNRHVMKAMAPFTEPSSNVPELKGFEMDWERIFGPEVLREDDGDTARDAQATPAWRDAIGEEGED
ncbi:MULTISPECIES: YbaB/EbfC family nucleoid-associated protein [Streptomyces]|uniref:YbaB/EbfC family nucleoid-associated protein n=1 Tax=Streptomyces glycanivorans TaxID=3033808 RepID=A0ABY9J9U1_9ACTN|nr:MULTISPECIES: YbaB/EbfC family nucleoid-associated protein [unclassified Streptomyces]WSQ76977.1 YbaB/EbfC family nucleoid-associated protein [Streptomyces sp. NBC_01213]TXS13183.1 YbaB/EbfC family DNA-binding protein [Streptomyces sp. wa22]WLQ63594.1 YbaB/EbfC family nucleoid-associated protein [Streptomyces sp. Alt3]WSQ84306.1 YbaB/EbfC family nucleoid-associated protein [Streptomyces sp. NBC_01212]WSR09637.1 YbaB/EbfC family nucleoid-associated protein [Streptomyces sp. NBC_01208]